MILGHVTHLRIEFISISKAPACARSAASRFAQNASVSMWAVVAVRGPVSVPRPVANRSSRRVSRGVWILVEEKTCAFRILRTRIHEAAFWPNIPPIVRYSEGIAWSSGIRRYGSVLAERTTRNGNLLTRVSRVAKIAIFDPELEVVVTFVHVDFFAALVCALQPNRIEMHCTCVRSDISPNHNGVARCRDEHGRSALHSSCCRQGNHEGQDG